MHIKEIRQQFPQYNDLNDGELIKGIHSKFYSDMPIGDLVSKIDFAPEQEVSGKEKALSAITGAADVASFGFADEIAGALDPTKTREDYRRVAEEVTEKAPGYALAGNIAGIVPLIASAPASAAIKGTGAALKAGKGLLSAMGSSAKVGGAFGALQGFGSGEGLESRIKSGLKTGATSAAISTLFPLASAAKSKIASKLTSSGRAGQITKGRGSLKAASKNTKATNEISRAMKESDELSEIYRPEVRELLQDTESRVVKLANKGLGTKNIKSSFQNVKDEFASALDKKGLKSISKSRFKAINTDDEIGSLFKKAQRLARRQNPKLAGLKDDSIRVMQDTKSVLGKMERKGGIDSVTAGQVKRDIANAIDDKISGFKDLTTKYAKTIQADDLADDLVNMKGAEISDFAKKLTSSQNKKAIIALKGEKQGNKLISALRKESSRFENLKEMDKASKLRQSRGDFPISKAGVGSILRKNTLGGVDKRTAEKILANAPTKAAKDNTLKQIMAIQPLIKGE